MAKASITRESLVGLALALADREGLEAVTFRRLADTLGVTPMALYHHVQSKADLLAAMIDRLLSEVDVPQASSSTRWEADLRALLRSYFTVRRRHPCAVELLKTTPALSPNVVRVTEGVLGILQQAGFATADAIQVVQQLAALLNVGGGMPASTSANDGNDWTALVAEAAPHMRRAAAHLGTWNAVENVGLDILVLGVKGVLQQRRRKPRRPKRR